MKSMIILCILSVVGLSLGGIDLYPRGCIYVNGHCYRGCEEGTQAYTTGCGYLTPEATCENPKPVEDRSGHICDFTACYCEPPTVRHSGKCIPLEECPKQ